MSKRPGLFSADQKKKKTKTLLRGSKKKKNQDSSPISARNPKVRRLHSPGSSTNLSRNNNRDLLTKDYISDQKLTVSTYSDTGVAITSTVVKKGGLSTGDLAAQYKYGNTLIDVKVDTASNITTTLTFTDIIPSSKTIVSCKLPDYNSSKITTTLTFTDIIPSSKTIVSCQLPDYNSSKLEVQYFHQHATLRTAFALNQSPSVDLSATIGTPTIYFGAEAGYETSSGKFTKYTAGVSVSKPDSCAAIILGDKGDSIRASYLHHLDQLKKSAVVGEITRKFSTNENTFTVGGLYAVDHLTVVKAKLNNHGKLGAVLQHELIPKSILTISSEFNTKALDETPRCRKQVSGDPNWNIGRI